jgi:hypothetical protein
MPPIPQIHVINPLEDARWMPLSLGHPKANVFHSVGWLTTLKKTYGYQPVAYTSSDPGAPLTNAIVFCQVRSWITGPRLVSLPFSDHCEPLISSVDELHSLLRQPQSELQDKKWKYIDLRPESLDYGTEATEGAEQYFLHVLDLSPDIQELHKRLHGDSIRRKIQRAEREHLALEAGSSETLLADFYKLHVVTRKRQHLPPHPESWFRNVLGCMGEDAKIRVAKKDERTIAAIMTLTHNRKIVYKYGCSDAQSHNLGGMQFLFWDLIRDAKARGFLELDFGRSECSNTGLVTFKDRWGTKRQLITYLRYPPRPATSGESLSKIMELGKKVFAHCPQSVLRLAGNLLYPHLG